MAKKKLIQNSGRSAAKIERERDIRERFQRDRPSLESLTSNGEFSPPLKQGESLMLMEFAARMKQVREQKQLSLTDVASRSGIDKSAISRLENGLTENPTIGTLSKVARSLGKRIRIELDDDVQGSGDWDEELKRRTKLGRTHMGTNNGNNPLARPLVPRPSSLAPSSVPPSRRHVLLIQLPIPPVGPEPIRGNVPLAGGYLKMYAERHGLAADYQIDILPTAAANTLGDRALVQEILAAGPWMVGFTCYLWNIQRTLWIAARLKEARPELLILLGGPEITADNDWVLRDEAVDFAAIGEGEQTFCDLLAAMRDSGRPVGDGGSPIPGLYVSVGNGLRAVPGEPLVAEYLSRPERHRGRSLQLPPPRKPLANLDQISSPYLAGILDAADEKMLLLETIRGCIFKCKFCYYPKSYDSLYFLSEEKIVANLEHARRRGVREVVLLDPTLNQRRDFSAFLKLLARCNPERQFTYFGELRAEGITPDVAQLLRDANFTEVEIGLQSIDPLAMELMDRKNNLRAFERGARAMLDLGIKVKVDLIIGLPGDSCDSVRRGLDYIHASGLYSEVQVFNLAILPGTSFRQEAALLGLEFQDRPPYYVLKTPTLDLPQMFELMQEAQELFETEFDPMPEPGIGGCEDNSNACRTIDLDNMTNDGVANLPPAAERSQAFTLRLRSTDFDRQRASAEAIVAQLLEENPYTTLQLILEPTADPQSLSPETLESLLAVCFRNPTYLDCFYSVLPGRPKGAKRLIVALPAHQRAIIDSCWIRQMGDLAAIVWHGPMPAGEELEDYEYVEGATAENDAVRATATGVAAR